MVLPEARRTLNIREQKGHGARRDRHHEQSVSFAQPRSHQSTRRHTGPAAQMPSIP
jgi:hypothetical protein